MADGTSRQQNRRVSSRQRRQIGSGEQNGCVVGNAAPRKNIFMRFLSYYVGQRHLFFIDMACALVIAVTELAFPQIYGNLHPACLPKGKMPF